MSGQAPISPSGIPIDVRPVRRDELGAVPLRCLPDGGRIETMFRTQGTIGFGAWDGEKCIAQLHCYRLDLPRGSSELWPFWSRPAYVDEILNGRLGITGAAWCHACIHVGRSVDSLSRSDEPDTRYFGRGIGTALVQGSIGWARAHHYAAVVAPGTPNGLMEYSIWVGGLPWTTYRKLGFSDVPGEVGDDLPDWAKGNSPPEVMEAVKAALAAGRPNREFHSRLMVLGLFDA
jgi:hypothetical protein